ncbi:class I SAM-dependent methyltransferase [Tabrizicola sp.]|uniref:class I SAM-dependent methyltransferase n=1 Tax=Tabrizicola sp. TaxID=2005166 RepID=UPI00262B1DCA|nr:class I SAM-dependent methyltransferase [Tabrizicola sp.]MDM7932950.1 class I SAM-dependent methyltransferase [Tabrizicola sp.]
MAVLAEAGMTPDDHLLDIGCGALRLGHLAVPYLRPGHYWGTDASLALMHHGRNVELADPTRLPPEQLVEDAAFAFPGIPDRITLAIAWGVFTHLPITALETALHSAARKLPRLRALLFTVFLAPDSAASAPHRQADGVVTHPDRAPRHFRLEDVLHLAGKAGMTAELRPDRLPRGQVLFHAGRVG